MKYAGEIYTDKEQVKNLSENELIELKKLVDNNKNNIMEEKRKDLINSLYKDIEEIYKNNFKFGLWTGTNWVYFSDLNKNEISLIPNKKF